MIQLLWCPEVDRYETGKLDLKEAGQRSGDVHRLLEALAQQSSCVHSVLLAPKWESEFNNSAIGYRHIFFLHDCKTFFSIVLL